MKGIVYFEPDLSLWKKIRSLWNPVNIYIEGYTNEYKDEMEVRLYGKRIPTVSRETREVEDRAVETPRQDIPSSSGGEDYKEKIKFKVRGI